MIAYEVPGMVFFTKTGEYGVGDGESYTYKHSMGKWFRQDISTGSQIDLLSQKIGPFRMCHVCETEQISDWQITLSSTGSHFAPCDSSGYPLEDTEEFVKPEVFTPILYQKGIQDTFLSGTNILVHAEEPATCDLHNAQAQAPDIQTAYG
jgi:hypothetical protein